MNNLRRKLYISVALSAALNGCSDVSGPGKWQEGTFVLSQLDYRPVAETVFRQGGFSGDWVLDADSLSVERDAYEVGGELKDCFKRHWYFHQDITVMVDGEPRTGRADAHIFARGYVDRLGQDSIILRGPEGDVFMEGVEFLGGLHLQRLPHQFDYIKVSDAPLLRND